MSVNAPNMMAQIRMARTGATQQKIATGEKDTATSRSINRLKTGTNTKLGKVLSYLNVPKMIRNLCKSIRSLLHSKTSSAIKSARVMTSEFTSNVSTGKTMWETVKDGANSMVEAGKDFVMPSISRSIMNNKAGRDACNDMRMNQLKQTITQIRHEQQSSKPNTPSKAAEVNQRVGQYIVQSTFGGSLEELGKSENIEILEQGKPYLEEAFSRTDELLDPMNPNGLKNIINQTISDTIDWVMERIIPEDSMAHDTRHLMAERQVVDQLLKLEDTVKAAFQEECQAVDQMNDKDLNLGSNKELTPERMREKTKEKLIRCQNNLLSQLKPSVFKGIVTQKMQASNSKVNDAILSNMQNTQNWGMTQGAGWASFTLAAHAVSCGMAAAVIPVLVHSSNTFANIATSAVRSMVSTQVKDQSTSALGAATTEKDVSKMNTFELIDHQLTQLQAFTYSAEELANPSQLTLEDQINVAQIKMAQSQQGINQLSATDSKSHQYKIAVDTRNQNQSEVIGLSRGLENPKQRQRKAVQSRVMIRLDQLSNSKDSKDIKKAEEMKSFISMMETVIDAKESITYTGRKEKDSDQASSFWDHVLNCDDKVGTEQYFINQSLHYLN